MMSEQFFQQLMQQVLRDWTLMVAPAYHDRIDGCILTVEPATYPQWIYGDTK